MLLRKLKAKDATLMLEWMHDDSVVHDLHTDFASKTIDNCLSYIESSQNTKTSMNLAVVNEKDEYMGTVSLKHINESAKDAEFAITIRKVAMGKGFSKYAMSEIIRIAFEDLKLKQVYWCVSEENARAIKFYEKQGYRACTNVSPEKLSRYDGIKMLRWYCADCPE